MRYEVLACAGLTLLLSACGGGGGGGGSNPPLGGPNTPPVAEAGPNQTVASGATVTLNGSASSDSDGSIVTYRWTQASGTPVVTLSSGSVVQPMFIAPQVVATSTIGFTLVVIDNRGVSSAEDSVSITINPPPPNQAPTANAGVDHTYTSGDTVFLNGSGSSDPDGSVAAYAWSQTGGTPIVTLSGASTMLAMFNAPTVAASTSLTFSLTVTDNQGAASVADTVTITILPPTTGNVTVSGRVTFGRVPFNSSPPNGLDYANPVQQNARGVIIQALRSATRSQIAATTTGADGRYSLSLPNNTSIVLQVEARLERQSPPPTWLVRVLDGNAGTPYTYSDGIPFVLGAAAVTRDIAIPTGINANGVATGARASGPFAILDTIYQSIQTVVAVEPNATFGTLLVDWGSQTDGTFYDSASRRIALLADLTEDTDEFDQHVIAHEFGHYLEHNFSRADSIGGSHVIGQRLDPRVAFGEGWGYAFAAIALGDTIARDSFVDNGTQRSSNLDIELNPTTPATGGGGTGCWCSESSVWSILYDVFDGNADANDSVVLGFGPIWDVLIDQQADTPAFTTIFSFISALKSQSTGQNAQIDTLVGAQNITTTGMDAFATTETSEPFAGVALTPIYTTITRGQTVTLRTIDDGGRYNKAGNRRFLRFDTGASNAPFTVSLSSSNPNNADPDFIIFNAGTPVLFATDPPGGGPQTGTLSNVSPNTTYVIDVHDCANGCSTEQGTPGDYDLTVTLN